MKRFHDRVYALSEQGLLIWEPSWEIFRPVKSLVWNPAHSQLEPYYGEYVRDLFDVHYGFSSRDLYDFCVEYTDAHVGEVEPAEECLTVDAFWRWANLPLTWIQDRPLAVHPCHAHAPDRKAYLARYSLRPRTLRHPPRNLRRTLKVSRQ